MRKLLVLEDDETTRLNLEAYLEEEGFTISSYDEAEAALAALPTFKPDLCIVDIRLPAMDGNQFILQSMDVDPNLKFIIYTGYPHYQLSTELTERGINPKQILHKPLLDMDQMLILIDELIV